MPLKNGHSVFFILWLITLVGFNSCKKELTQIDDEPYVLDIPKGFPPMDIPADNQMTRNRVELGKMLFFDPALSADSTVSCASCHHQHLAFSDDRILSLGVNEAPGIRNSPSMGNIGYHNSFFRDGGVPTLEQQILAPISDPREMAFSVPGVVERMKANPTYVTLSRLAYDREPDPFVLTRAIASYERTLITGNSRYDRYKYHGVISALNASERKGLAVFQKNCSGCHSGFNFTDLSFRNNGLYEIYADTGRKRITLLNSDYGKFKVPSLRNVELTAPYMHDGSLATLEDVIDHYNSGGKNNRNQDALIRPLELSASERDDLVNFLKALTDETFTGNAVLSP